MTGSRAYCNLPSSANKDELAEGAFTKDSNTSSLIPAISKTPIPALASAVTPSLLSMYINVDLQKTTRLVLELFIQSQEHG